MKRLLFIVIAFSLVPLNAQTNDKTWTKIAEDSKFRLEKISKASYSENQQLYLLNNDNIKQALVNANDKLSQKEAVAVSFPNVNGVLEKFMVWENSNFELELQNKYPQIRAYIGKSTLDKTATIHISISPDGIQSMVLRANNENEFIQNYDKKNNVYVLFDAKTRTKEAMPFTCNIDESNLNEENLNQSLKTLKSNNGVFKTMRLALSCTAEYTQFFYGGEIPISQQAIAKQKALAAMNNTMTRVNGIYEKDLALHINIIANNDALIYIDPLTDPYSNAAQGAGGNKWSAELQTNLTNVIGNAGYDVGHLFGRSGGGGSGGCFGCVCVNDLGGNNTASKGKGYTSPADGDDPQGDTFDIDYVAHELGHQLGAYHTYSASYEAEGSRSVQVEPGSGSTIMGYAGITNYDVQNRSDPYFTYRSIQQIQNNLINKACLVSTPVNNATPLVNAGSDFTIPGGTAYVLKGTATDADGDALTYCWEQNDPIKNYSEGNQNSVVYPEKITGPNYRSFLPVNSPDRMMPKLNHVLNGILSSDWESVSTVNRTLTFTLTVRDNNVNGAQTNTDQMTITSKEIYDAATAVTGAGPFEVTSQKTAGLVWQQGAAQTITWNVNNTTSLPGSANVNIKLSIDGGVTFPYVLASNVPNNGTAVITVPKIAFTSNACRLWIAPTDNIYFAINAVDFQVTTSLANEEFNLEGFNLYPNPNKGNFTVQFNSTTAKPIAIEVYDLRGRKVFNQEYTNETMFSQNINLSKVQSGIYIVTVKDGDKKVNKKIVVE